LAPSIFHAIDASLRPLPNGCNIFHSPKLSPAVFELIFSVKVIGVLLTADCFDHLSGLPHLRTTLCTDNWIRTRGRTQSRSLLQHFFFPALRQLSITHKLVDHYNRLHMRHLHRQIVEIVEAEEVPLQQKLTRLLDTVLDCCLPIASSLRQLVLRPDDIGKSDENPPCVVNPPAIHRFFAFPNLEVLRILIAVSFDEIDDVIIRDMA
jgi:hypothetical protein